MPRHNWMGHHGCVCVTKECSQHQHSTTSFFLPFLSLTLKQRSEFAAAPDRYTLTYTSLAEREEKKHSAPLSPSPGANYPWQRAERVSGAANSLFWTANCNSASIDMGERKNKPRRYIINSVLISAIAMMHWELADHSLSVVSSEGNDEGAMFITVETLLRKCIYLVPMTHKYITALFLEKSVSEIVP